MSAYLDDDDERDPEEPEDFDRDDDPEGTDTEPCPGCGREVHANTDICPYCGQFIIRNEGYSRRLVWIIATIGVILMMGLMILSHGSW